MHWACIVDRACEVEGHQTQLHPLLMFNHLLLWSAVLVYCACPLYQGPSGNCTMAPATTCVRRSAELPMPSLQLVSASVHSHAQELSPFACMKAESADIQRAECTCKSSSLLQQQDNIYSSSRRPALLLGPVYVRCPAEWSIPSHINSKHVCKYASCKPCGLQINCEPRQQLQFIG